MINLLPPKEKIILAQERNKRVLIILGILILVFCICLSLCLFFTQKYISRSAKSQETIFEQEKNQLKDFGVEEFQNKISLINKNLSQLNSFYNEKTYLSSVLEKLSSLMPPGVYLTDFSFSQKEKPVKSVKKEREESSKTAEDEIIIEKEISLYGFSPSRESLFKFKEEIEKEEIFKDIYFPSSNWIKSSDIDFYLTLKID